MPEAATCPRCGGGFDCGARDGHCACFELTLSAEQQAAIAAQWQGCLCLRCLVALQQPTRSPSEPASAHADRRC
ncbi:MAG: cysteine-rich CWC family protein [Inhella sp.]|uniref:cysteine-rich CWC family protein n=1 Tax=Inhella sp. TaxID=1921806 RepID=UPI0022BB8A5B|nr:cysteine-rich CWC family protein [Inhella sp.]MCZ8233590.1 cysteine-rich CWC family protein [Inhella sp.]